MQPPTQSLGVAYLFTLMGALVMVGGVSLIRSKGWATPLQGRKLMHLTTGPVFILCWLLFPPSPWSAPLAASVPLCVAIYMLLNSLGLARNAALIQTVSRSGHPRELRLGPFHYGLIHALACYCYWTHRPTGIVALLTLCVGDGVADLVGRPWGRHRWSHNSSKSLQGSLAFVLATTAALFAFVQLWMHMGLLPQSQWPAFQWQLPLVAVVACLIESLPLGSFDNIGVFLGVAAMGHVLGW